MPSNSWHDLWWCPKTEAVTELQENAEVAKEADHKAEIGAYTGADKDAFETEDKDDWWCSSSRIQQIQKESEK